MCQCQWRLAEAAHDDSIAEMCRCLYIEDPGQEVVPPDNIHTTLAVLRRSPDRGRAVILHVNGEICGYALLIAYWSNELGGDICQVDELYVVPQHRNHGHGSVLFADVERGGLWPGPITAIALGTTRGNFAARRLYVRLGFEDTGVAMIRRIRQGSLSAASGTRLQEGFRTRTSNV